MRTSLRAALLALGGAAGLAACAGQVRSAVLGSDQAELVAEQCSRPNPPRYDSTWKPEPKLVEQLETDLSALKELAPAGCCGGEVHVGEAGAYDRQYFGLVVQGKRLIYVNAFQHGMANKDWRHYAIVICDGGTAAWGALYDPASRRFSDLAFNGGLTAD